MINDNMKILKEQYGFDTIAAREQTIDFSKFKGGKVLDIGTGSGWMAIVLAKRGYEVVTIDIDEGALRRAKERALEKGIADNIIFKKDDATQLSFSDDTFEAVFSFDSMHHVADCHQAITEMFRVCKPSGWVVISDLNAKGLKAIRQVLTERGDKHYENPCRLDMVRQIVKEFDQQVQCADLEFTSVFVAHKCPQDAIEQIERLLERLFRVYSQKSRHEMLDSGLTNTQARALQALSDGSSHNISQLNDALFVECSTTTRILDGLVKKGWVKRKRSNDDRRTVNVWLTQEGKSVVNNIRCCMVSIQREMLSNLSQSEQLEILKALRTLMAAFAH